MSVIATVVVYKWFSSPHTLGNSVRAFSFMILQHTTASCLPNKISLSPKILFKLVHESGRFKIHDLFSFCQYLHLAPLLEHK